MKKHILFLCYMCSVLALVRFLFNSTRIGTDLRVLIQMAFPPDDLFANKVEVPILEDVNSYEIVITNKFIGNYAIRIKVPNGVHECEIFQLKPPHLQYVKYFWEGGTFEQSPCKRSWYSIGDDSCLFSYESVRVPTDVPQSRQIKVWVQLPKEAQKFFIEHPGCRLIFGKDSDE